MNYYVKVTAILGRNRGLVGYLINEHACNTGANGKGTVFTKEEAEATFSKFNKRQIWKMELEPTEELTVAEFLAALPQEH